MYIKGFVQYLKRNTFTLQFEFPSEKKKRFCPAFLYVLDLQSWPMLCDNISASPVVLAAAGSSAG